MTREQQLQRWLFEAKQSENGLRPLSYSTVVNGLSHALGCANRAVSMEAARMFHTKLGERHETA